MSEDAAVLLPQALAGLGFHVESCRSLSAFGRPPRRRGAFLLATQDGRQFKGRVFLSEADAARVGRRLAELEGLPLPRRVASLGRVAVETWIEGTPCAPDACEPALLGAAARLLAGIHQRPSGEPIDGDAALALMQRTAHERLGALVAAGVVDTVEREALAGALFAAPSRAGATGIVHGDFCAANLVRGRDAGLYVVDNEELTLGLLDYDLGMVWYRWGLDSGSAACFAEAYMVAAGREPTAPTFFRALAVVKGLWVRWTLDPASLPVARRRIADLSTP